MHFLVDEKNIKACGLFLPPDLVSPSWLFGSPSGNYSRGIFSPTFLIFHNTWSANEVQALIIMWADSS